MTDPAILLDWDSAFFGKRIGRLLGDRLDDARAEAALAWCAREKIDCLYFLAAADDAPTVRSAERHGFSLVDLRVTLDIKLQANMQAERQAVREHNAGDRAALRAIARASYRDSRFYFDPNFSDDDCDRLYETWIERSCDGWADAVLVSEHDGEVAGYITCHLDTPGEGHIGLLGVGARAQGHGVGGRLIAGALGWFGERAVQRVTVVTQGRNVRAQRAYQHQGFRTERLQLWYHRWFQR
jgi:dTDP-4-amino-4,6-dideoxy-D-galactose acyltransferase